MLTKKKNQSSEAGNVLAYILLFTGLLVALTYAVTKTGRDTAGVVREKQLIDASLLVQYGTSMADAIRQMMVRGIDPVAISFIDPGDGAFNTPPDTAKVFHPGGGNVGYETNVDGLAAFVYSANSEIENVGIAGAKDILFVAEVKATDTCKMINQRHTGSDTIPTLSNAVFNALLAGTATTVNAAACASCVGRKFLCVKNATNGRILYYHVLLDQ